MTIVLVHGNPETEAIWADLRTYLGSQLVVCAPRNRPTAPTVAIRIDTS